MHLEISSITPPPFDSIAIEAMIEKAKDDTLFKISFAYWDGIWNKLAFPAFAEKNIDTTLNEKLSATNQKVLMVYQILLDRINACLPKYAPLLIESLEGMVKATNNPEAKNQFIASLIFPIATTLHENLKKEHPGF